MKRVTIPFVAAMAGLLTLAPAQHNDAERTQGELARTERQLQSNRAEVDRLLELRLRHDLGLPTEEAERTFRPPAPVATESMERMSQELAAEEAATASLLEQYNKVRAQVEQLKAEAEARLQHATEAPPFVTVPAVGAAAPTRRVAEPRPNETAKPAPAGETAPLPTDALPTDALPTSAPLGPLRAQITGSTDHQLVAQALFKAGQQQMDDAARAVELGHPEVARQFAERGKESLKRALDELAPLLQAKEPPYAALFYQGRCLELLFRHSERYEQLDPQHAAVEYQKREQEVRDPFLRITVRDVRKTGERRDVDTLGPWGLAAQAAMVHFGWMNQRAGYDVLPTIEALTWPGEKAQ